MSKKDQSTSVLRFDADGKLIARETDWCSKLSWLDDLAKGNKPKKAKKVKNPYDITCEPKPTK
jgi:hypothetical protein